MKIVGFSVGKLSAPLNQPFRTALGSHAALENLRLTLQLQDGTMGFGEAAIATHITGETLEQTEKNLRGVGEGLIGRRVDHYGKISVSLHERLATNKTALAAVEGALLDLFTRYRKIPLWRLFGSTCQRLTTDITIVIADLAETRAAVKKFYRQGFRTFKVKIGQNEELDFERVLLVKKVAPRCRIYLDANQGLTADQTLRFLKRLDEAGIRPDLLEQPVPREDWEGLKKVNRLSAVPVCADESVRSLSEALRAIREKAVRVINIKLAKTGLLESRQIAQKADAAGIKLMMGGMLESSLAMTTAAHFAAGMGYFDYIDLDTPFFIRSGFDANPFLSSKGTYDLRRVKAGVGIPETG